MYSIVLDSDVPSLNEKDGQELILDFGQSQTVSFNQVPENFIISSATLRTYGHYLSYPPEDFLKNYNYLLTNSKLDTDGIAHYYFTVALKTDLEKNAEIEIVLLKKLRVK